MRAEPSGELLDPGHSVVAALLDDVGDAELAGQRLTVGVSAERDDALGAELLGGQYAEQADRAVADHGDRLAGPGLGSDGGEPAGAQHVGGRHQGGDEVGIGHLGDRLEGSVGERDAASSDWVPMVPIRTRCTQWDRYPAWQISHVLSEAQKDPDDEIADLDVADLRADLLDHADVLVAHHLMVDRLGAAVGPQVAAADAGRREPDDRVRRLDDRGVLAVLDPHVPGSVHDNLTHRRASSSSLIA